MSRRPVARGRGGVRGRLRECPPSSDRYGWNSAAPWPRSRRFRRSPTKSWREQKFKAAALAILGARAAEKYDAKAARAYFQRAIAAARPQERMQIRRMADASLALAERRPGDLKQAVERLGQEAPSSRQLFMLRLVGLVAPPKSAGTMARMRGIGLIILIIAALLAIALGIVELISLATGTVGIAQALIYAILLLIAVLVVLILVGRRRQAKMQAGRPG